MVVVVSARRRKFQNKFSFRTLLFELLICKRLASLWRKSNHDKNIVAICTTDIFEIISFSVSVFSVLFTNICASKTFLGQERTLTTFGTSTRLNFMPLRADESIETHPIYTTPNTFLQLYLIYFSPPASPALPPPPFFLVRPLVFFACGCSDEVDD